MHVEHLLTDHSLGLRPLWAQDAALLAREISGVTVTDLEDPARFVRPGEVVLSGLVWWAPGKAERFVSALKAAGAAALFAGEETHGGVPEELVEACVRHGVPVAGVPAHIMFRAITDTVYLRQWGELSRRQALPETVRVRLSRLLAQESGPVEILAAAFAHLDRTAAYVFTPSGRTVAATAAAPGVPAREAAALVADGRGMTVSVAADSVSPYERWLLYLPEPDSAPAGMLHEVAAALGRCQETAVRRRSAERQTADELGALLAGAGAGAAEGVLPAAVRECGLPADGPYRVVVADTGARRPGLAEGALAEVAGHVAPQAPQAAVGRLPDGTAFAVLPAESIGEAWELVAGCEPGVPLHGGTGSVAAGPGELAGAQARYALTSARATAPDASVLTDTATLTSLEALLTGVPADVRAAYRRTVLGSLLTGERAASAVLLSTLETFLACDGSWARTAEALHLHVNTVHYRMQRVEHFTGRDLSRLSDRLDLWAALLCR
ncbi:PucR family transcriptional regulator [Streptomyces sp. GbtcB6]|uniref:helix-turn-helix domain-containing protein n=1 Tax=Streptomyces sp. GbtcB6 TaxID=2824751 RepID=UPI001C2F4BB1|nr:PucR family transcriptional regulator [Streptomyces sp. GbtcB6]